jgi:hypothetical protein
MKSRRIRWAGHVERMEKMRNVCGVLVEKPEGKYHLGKQSIDGRIRLKRILGKYCLQS